MKGGRANLFKMSSERYLNNDLISFCAIWACVLHCRCCSSHVGTHRRGLRCKWRAESCILNTDSRLDKIIFKQKQGSYTVFTRSGLCWALFARWSHLCRTREVGWGQIFCIPSWGNRNSRNISHCSWCEIYKYEDNMINRSLCCWG